MIALRVAARGLENVLLEITSLDAQSPSSAAWSVAFGAGESARTATSTQKRSRCVRGDAPARVHYQVAADIVTDLWTGLAWQRRLASAGTMTWTDALLLCQGARTGGRSGWRLPTARELESIVDVRAKAAPTLRATELATDEVGATLWSITSVVGAVPARSWAVDFTPDHTPTTLETGAGAVAAVRCVAGP